MQRHTVVLTVIALVSCGSIARAQHEDLPGFRPLFNGKDLSGWMPVNTAPETWSVRDGLLVCSGHPTGVMRSAKQYENFKKISPVPRSRRVRFGLCRLRHIPASDDTVLR